MQSSPLGVLQQEPESRIASIKKKIAELKTAARGFITEGFIDTKGLSTLFHIKFSSLKLSDIPGLYFMVVNYESDGNSRAILSSKTAPDMLIADAMMQTIALPVFFDPVRHGGQIMADGGLTETVPFAAALIDASADMAIGTALNYRIPKSRTDFYGFTGIVGQGSRNFDIMQRAVTYWMMMYLTKKSPGEIAREGDQYGICMLDMADLRNVNPFDLYVKGPQLLGPGRGKTTDMVSRFLNPEFAHQEYNPDVFLRKLQEDPAKRIKDIQYSWKDVGFYFYLKMLQASNSHKAILA